MALLAALSVLLILGMHSKSKDTGIATQEEIRMAQIIRKIDGVKSAAVMINYDSEQEKRGIVVVASGVKDIRTMLVYWSLNPTAYRL